MKIRTFNFSIFNPNFQFRIPPQLRGKEVKDLIQHIRKAVRDDAACEVRAARAFELTPATTGVLVHATRREADRALAVATPQRRLWWEPQTGRVDRARWATMRARSFPTLSPLSPGPRAKSGGAR